LEARQSSKEGKIPNLDIAKVAGSRNVIQSLYREWKKQNF
jgi:hypothetical protein